MGDGGVFAFWDSDWKIFFFVPCLVKMVDEGLIGDISQRVVAREQGAER